jgi:hypothetical protein
MNVFTRRIVPLTAASFLVLACGGGPSGHSAVLPETLMPATTVEQKRQICEAVISYSTAAVDSPGTYCVWTAQSAATGTTDAELQLSCLVAQAVCMQTMDERFAELQGVTDRVCNVEAPLSNTTLNRYTTCPITVGELEDCAIELSDTQENARNVQCGGLTLARSAAISDAANGLTVGPACQRINAACP